MPLTSLLWIYCYGPVDGYVRLDKGHRKTNIYDLCLYACVFSLSLLKYLRSQPELIVQR